jgi:crossover junction endodeoxyribonuclease RusA
MTERSIRLTLPLPPGVNNQYVTVGRRRVLSRAAKAFHKDAALVLRACREHPDTDEDWLAGLRGQPLACDLLFYFETPYRRDLDGGLKIALDAVCTGLGLDDRYIVNLTLAKHPDPLRPRLELELGAASGWEMDQQYVVLEG